MGTVTAALEDLRVTSTTHELGASVGAWNAVIRRARIGRERKAAALVVSSYARANGTGIHCGVARLAVDLEVSYSTAKRALAWLRKVGLIELVRAGNRRRQLSDEYRLILGPDVLEHLDVLNPAEHSTLIGDLRVVNRGADRGSSRVTRVEPVDNSDCGSPMVTPDREDPTEFCGSSRVTPKTQVCGSPMSEPPSPKKDLSLLEPKDNGDLGGRLTLGSDANSKHLDPSAKCVHGLKVALRPDGRPGCALCRIELDRAAGITRPGNWRPPDPPPASSTSRIAPVIDLRTREAQ